MAKIGTAHVEIKPVLNEEALAEIVKRIEDAVAAGVARALVESTRGTVRVAAVGEGLTAWQDGKPIHLQGGAK